MLLTHCKNNTAVKSLQTELEERLKRQEKEMADLQTIFLTIASEHFASPVIAPLPLPTPFVKSYHLKLKFSTFERQSDVDPLLYLTKCLSWWCILLHFPHSKLILLTQSLTPNHNLTVY